MGRVTRAMKVMSPIFYLLKLSKKTFIKCPSLPNNPHEQGWLS